MSITLEQLKRLLPESRDALALAEVTWGPVGDTPAKQTILNVLRQRLEEHERLIGNLEKREAA